jgi:hypothetical protein
VLVPTSPSRIGGESKLRLHGTAIVTRANQAVSFPRATPSLSALAAKAQKPRWKVLDVDADAVPAERVRRVDHGDRQLELAHDRQDGDGERSLFRVLRQTT